jgi:F-type H+-transporting ATPase subunit b
LSKRTIRQAILVLSLLLVILTPPFFDVTAVFATEEAGAHEEGQHGETWVQVAGRWLNFILLAAILYLFLKKTVRIQDRFRTDENQIRSSIESARLAKEEAEQKLRELEGRLSNLNAEIDTLKSNALKQADLERELILDSARKEAERIVEQAHREIDSQVEIAAKELRTQVADLAIRKGREIIEKEIAEPDQKHLIQDYIKGFGK